MDKYITKIGKRIKSIQIQGARKVALAVINALMYQTQNSKAKSIPAFYKEFLDVSHYLYNLRPTEPMTRNTINRILNYCHLIIRNNNVGSNNGGKKIKPRRSLSKIKELIIQNEKQLIRQMETNREKIAKYGSEIIESGMTVMTYCHSSTAVNVLKYAKDESKKISVISCETRPLFQGRITVRELASHKIPTTLIVDGASNAFIKDVDMVLVGGDAVTSKGNLINKIGTSTLAHIAYAHDTPFYSAIELFKFDPLTLFGFNEKIEERNGDEIWKSPPRGVRIRNPAFDTTFARYISGYITEEGIIPPQSLMDVVSKKYNMFKRIR